MALERVAGSSSHGSWEYLAWRPAYLAPLVELLWAFTGPTAHARKRIFPTGCVELILDLAEPYQVIAGATSRAVRGGFVSGLMEGPMVLVQPAWQRCLAARLTPRGARALFGRPLVEITGENVDLPDLVGPDAKALIEQCAALDTHGGLARLAAWLAARQRRANEPDPAIAHATFQIVHRGGVLPIAELERQLGVSRTTLAARFRDHVGVTPKRYARIVRLRGVLAELQRGGAPLARVALDRGFYDQSHLNTEFRALTGITPCQFLAARHPVGDGVTASD
jgi:AraC-like DNA-binding protein